MEQVVRIEVIRAESVAKLGIVEEETDESIHWMEMLVEAERIAANRMAALMAEAEGILAMGVASFRTARGRKR